MASQTRFKLGAKLEAFLVSMQRKFSEGMAVAASSKVTSGSSRPPLMRSPSNDDTGEYAEYNALRAKAAEMEGARSPVVGTPKSPIQ